MVSDAGDEAATADFRILGPLVVVSYGSELRITTRRMRALLVLLLMSPGRAIPSDRLIDHLWDGAAPPQAPVTLRSYISNLRQALGGPQGLGAALVTRAQGYAIDIAPERVDAYRLASLSTQGRELLRAQRDTEALAAFEAAVALWGGDPLADVADHEAAQSTITQLHETYLGAVEGRFEALLRLGRHQDALPALEAFVAEHPLREAPHAQLMLALYRSGRTPDALAVHQRFRTLLNDELGIDPSSQLDDLLQKVLTQDPSLDAPSSPQDTMNVKQQAAPLDPNRVPMVPGSAASEIVGRAREVASLATRIETLLVSNAGSLVLLAGEPGIGKTTLLEAADRSARGAGLAVHLGRTPAAATGAPPFWPWTQVLESVASGLDDNELRAATAGSARSVTRLAPAIAERLGQPLPVAGESAQALRFILYEAVSAFLRQATNGRATVLILDDIHWADAPSLELLSYITPTLSSRPLLILAAYRNLTADRTPDLDACLATVFREDNVHELTVNGLAKSAVETLIFDIPDSTLPPITDADTRASVANMMYDRTGGNPFFIRQLARLLSEAHPETAEAAFTPLPAGVRHVITSRLNSLSPSTRDLLDAAALVGRDFEVGATGRVVGLTVDQSLDAYDEAAQHGLVEPVPDDPSARRFAHALVQEALVEGLPQGRAAKLHAAIARQLEEGPPASAETLARHMWEARDVVRDAAIPSQLAAAESAAVVFAYDQAEKHLRRALVLVTSYAADGASLELQLLLQLFRLITAERGWGDPDVLEVAARARQLASAATFDDTTAILWWFLFFALVDRNDKASYIDVASSLLDAVNEYPPEDQRPDATEGSDDETTRQPPFGRAARCAVHLMNVMRYLGEGDQGRAEEQLRLARTHINAAPLEEVQAFDENLHVMLLLIEGYWAALTGDAEKHASTTGAAVALADADGRPFPRAVSRSLAAVSATYVAGPEFVGDLARDAAELNERYGFSWLATVTSSVLAWVAAHETNDWDRSASEIEDNLTAMRAAGRLGSMPTTELLLGDVYALAGRADDARRVYDGLLREPGPYQGLFQDHVARRQPWRAR